MMENYLAFPFLTRAHSNLGVMSEHCLPSSLDEYV